jgi:uncharacterized secreted protein with C-terminal beta-propeller domain
MNRKYLFIMVCFALLLFFSFNQSVQATSPKVLLNGSYMNLGGVGPVLENNRTLVPIRPLAEALNCSISFDAINQKVSLENDISSIEFIIGQQFASKNGQEVFLDVPAKLIGNSTYVPLRFIAENFDANVTWDAENKIANIDTSSDNNYATVQSEEDFKNILRDYTSQRDYSKQMLKGMEEVQTTNRAAADAAAPTAASGTRFSETNVQVKGVDESDIVKTDGKYIYQIRGDLITISEVYPANEMRFLKNIDFDDNNFVPSEIYVDENHLVVLGTTYKHDPKIEKINYDNIPIGTPEADMGSKMSIMPERIMPPYYQGITLAKMVSYNIADKNNITFERELQIEGNYISSRKVGNYVYFITNKYVDFYGGDVRPLVMDSATQPELKAINYSDIHYFPKYVSPNLISVIALDLDGGAKQAKVETYLGSSENIFMSDKNLYIAQSPDYNETAIYKFNIDQDNIKYVNKGIVKGRILNQFSMDEFDDSFRIATTSWNNNSNNVFVLDSQMKTIGKLTGLAPNERIYSARFIGKKAYLVTFEQIDPLFVIDLSNQTEPKVLGALKIPGFSNYLHPLDENHILGIGRDTSIVEENNFSRVKQGGIKIAIFDVSDVARPVQKSMIIIGDSGSHSEALYNHKAVLFDQENNLLALPINLVQYQGGTYNRVIETQSLFVLDVNVNKPISTRGQISHQDGYYSQNSQIKRSLYIDDILYTVSNSKIKANLITNLQEVGILQF